MALAIVAFAYAVVGHAGASGYIAVFALANAAPEQIKKYFNSSNPNFNNPNPNPNLLPTCAAHLVAANIEDAANSLSTSCTSSQTNILCLNFNNPNLMFKFQALDLPILLYSVYLTALT